LASREICFVVGPFELFAHLRFVDARLGVAVPAQLLAFVLAEQ